MTGVNPSYAGFELKQVFQTMCPSIHQTNDIKHGRNQSFADMYSQKCSKHQILLNNMNETDL